MNTPVATNRAIIFSNRQKAATRLSNVDNLSNKLSVGEYDITYDYQFGLIGIKNRKTQQYIEDSSQIPNKNMIAQAVYEDIAKKVIRNNATDKVAFPMASMLLFFPKSRPFTLVSKAGVPLSAPQGVRIGFANYKSVAIPADQLKAYLSTGNILKTALPTIYSITDRWIVIQTSEKEDKNKVKTYTYADDLMTIPKDKLEAIRSELSKVITNLMATKTDASTKLLASEFATDNVIYFTLLSPTGTNLEKSKEFQNWQQSIMPAATSTMGAFTQPLEERKNLGISGIQDTSYIKGLKTLAAPSSLITNQGPFSLDTGIKVEPLDYFKAPINNQRYVRVFIPGFVIDNKLQQYKESKVDSLVKFAKILDYYGKYEYADNILRRIAALPNTATQSKDLIDEAQQADIDKRKNSEQFSVAEKLQAEREQIDKRIKDSITNEGDKQPTPYLGVDPQEAQTEPWANDLTPVLPVLPEYGDGISSMKPTPSKSYKPEMPAGTLNPEGSTLLYPIFGKDPIKLPANAILIPEGTATKKINGVQAKQYQAVLYGWIPAETKLS